MVVGFLRGMRYAQRLAICVRCPHQSLGNCGLLAAACRAVARFAHQDCPQQRWPEIDPADPDLLAPEDEKEPGNQPMGRCRHLGPLAWLAPCADCAGQVRVKVYRCDVHGHCSLERPVPDAACCRGCPEYEPALLPGE